MRVLFYIPNHTGHHFVYLARMLPGFIGLPIEILVATTPEALESVEYSKSLAPLADSIKFVPCCTPTSRHPIRDSRHRLRELVHTIRTTEPDHLAVCYVDRIWEYALLWRMVGCRIWPRDLVAEGWLYRGRFGDLDDHPLSSRLRRWLFPRLLRDGLFRKLHLDHELLYEWAAPLAAGTPTEVVLTPNPIVLEPPLSKPAARRRLGLPTEGQWLSLSGQIYRYKGAYLLLDAYRRIREADGAPAVGLVLVGPHEPGVRELLGTAPYRGWVQERRIVSLDRFVDEGEMFAAAAAADLVVAPYPHHHGRSSIILWAAAAGRPSLGADDSNIGYVIRQQGLGKTCNVRDPSALARAISAALAMPWTEADAQRVRRYAEFHRVENYQQMASQLLRERLGEAAYSC